MLGLSSRSDGEPDVRCSSVTSQFASFTPRLWWEVRDSVRCAFRLRWCVGSLEGLWYALYPHSALTLSLLEHDLSFVSVEVSGKLCILQLTKVHQAREVDCLSFLRPVDNCSLGLDFFVIRGR